MKNKVAKWVEKARIMRGLQPHYVTAWADVALVSVEIAQSLLYSFAIYVSLDRTIRPDSVSLANIDKTLVVPSKSKVKDRFHAIYTRRMSPIQNKIKVKTFQWSFKHFRLIRQYVPMICKQVFLSTKSNSIRG